MFHFKTHFILFIISLLHAQNSNLSNPTKKLTKNSLYMDKFSSSLNCMNIQSVSELGPDSGVEVHIVRLLNGTYLKTFQIHSNLLMLNCHQSIFHHHLSKDLRLNIILLNDISKRIAKTTVSFLHNNTACNGKSSKPLDFSLYCIYRINTVEKQKPTKNCTCCSKHLTLILQKQPFSYKQTVLRVIYYEIEPDISKRNTSQLVAGSQYKFLREIITRENITVEFHEKRRATGYGIQQANGDWSGLIGNLQRNEADLLPVVIPTWARYQVIDFSNLVYVTEIGYYIKTPPLQRSWSGLLWLPWKLWLMWLTVFATMVFLTCLQAKQEKELLLISKIMPIVLKQFLKILIEQPVSATSRILSKNTFHGLLTLLWIWTCFLVERHYNGNLIRGLTLKIQDDVPKSFRQLNTFNPKYNTILCELVKHGLPRKTFNSSPNPYLKSISNKWKIERASLTECMNKTATLENTVCIYYTIRLSLQHATTFDFDNVKNVDRLMVVKPGEVLISHTFGMAKNSVFKNLINWYVDQARSSSLMDRWNKEYLDEERRLAKVRRRKIKASYYEKCTTHKNKWCALTSEDLFYVFVVKKLAYIGAIVNVLWEVYSHRRKKWLSN